MVDQPKVEEDVAWNQVPRHGKRISRANTDRVSIGLTRSGISVRTNLRWVLPQSSSTGLEPTGELLDGVWAKKTHRRSEVADSMNSWDEEGVYHTDHVPFPPSSGNYGAQLGNHAIEMASILSTIPGHNHAGEGWVPSSRSPEAPSVAAL